MHHGAMRPWLTAILLTWGVTGALGLPRLYADEMEDVTHAFHTTPLHGR
jgi:hypothetical protein